MARTFRRQQARYEYPRVLLRKGLHWSEPPQYLDPRSIEGLRAIRLFHADQSSLDPYARCPASKVNRKPLSRAFRYGNNRQLRRCLREPGFEPAFQTRHRHSATAGWWLWNWH